MYKYVCYLYSVTSSANFCLLLVTQFPRISFLIIYVLEDCIWDGMLAWSSGIKIDEV
jgi:hypothetical protein